MSKKVKVFLIIFAVIIVGLIVFSYCEDYKYRYEDEKERDKYLSNIIYEVSDSFKRDEYTYSVNYSYYQSYNHCSFEIKYFDNYNKYVSGDEYLRDNIRFTLNDDVENVKEVDINNNKWYLIIKNSKSYKNYYYATIYNGVGYYMEYEIYDYNNGDYEGNNNFCEVSYNKIISSVRFK